MLTRRCSLALALAALPLLGACGGPPSVAEAEQVLAEAPPEQAWSVAVEAWRHAAPEERPAALRVALRAALRGGWTPLAARCAELLGAEDARLQEELGRGGLAAALTADDPARRLRALEALALVPHDPGLRPLLERLGRDPEAEVRAAAQTLRRAWDLPLQAQDADPRVRAAALRAAQSAPEPERLALARDGLGDADREVRLVAVTLLGGRSTPDELALLRTAAGHGDETTARAATRALLAAVGPGPAWDAWRAGGVPPAGASGAFAAVLAAQADPGALPAARGALSPARPWAERLAAARAAAGPAAVALAPQLLTLAGTDPSHAVRAAALEALLAGSAQEALPALEQALRHADPATRSLAFRLLEQLRPWSPEELLALWAGQDPALQAPVAVLLAERCGPAGTRALREALHGLRALPAVRALVRVPDPAAVGDLLALVRGPDPTLARQAAQALIRAAGPGDGATLVEACQACPPEAEPALSAALLALRLRAARGEPSEPRE